MLYVSTAFRKIQLSCRSREKREARGTIAPQHTQHKAFCHREYSVHRQYKRAPHTRHIHPPRRQVMNGCRQSSDTQVDKSIACKYRK